MLSYADYSSFKYSIIVRRSVVFVTSDRGERPILLLELLLVSNRRVLTKGGGVDSWFACLHPFSQREMKSKNSAFLVIIKRKVPLCGPK